MLAKPLLRFQYALLGLCSTLFLTGCGDDTVFSLWQNRTGRGICGTIILILDIIAIVEIAGSSRSTMGKVLWILLVLFFPLGGILLYYIFGR